MAISGNIAIVGASENRDAGFGSGSAYLFAVTSEVPIRLTSFTVRRRNHAALLTWKVEDAVNHLGFHVYRGEAADNRLKLTDEPLSDQTEYEFWDTSPLFGATKYWLEEISRTGQTIWHGPVVLEAATIGPVIFSAHPNPFRSTTPIQFALKEAGFPTGGQNPQDVTERDRIRGE